MLGSGSVEEALRLTLAADDLRRGADTRRLLAVMNLLTGDFPSALRAYISADPHA
jgi:hypothetical protein